MTRPPASPPALSLSAALRLPLINRWLGLINPSSVVEVGAGMGAMGFRLAARYDYRGYEPDPTSYEVASSRVTALGRGEVRNTEIPLEPDRRFDLLVAFEVLEHIEDDVTALTSWARWLAPDGHVLMSMPSNPGRYGAWDEKVGHYRRYSRESLAGVLAAAGFEPRAVESWGMPLGYLLETARNLIARRRLGETEVGTSGSGRVYQPPSNLGRSVELAMRPVAAVQRPFRDTDLGIGFVAVGRLLRESMI
ncbi:MAG TPA: class I SAM-dependent methyltransferase [Acidimicrobiia bacterium]